MSGSQPQLKLFGAEDTRSNSQLLLGTSRWTGEGWVGSFYPVGAKPADFLSVYSEKFRTVEVDSTFYRIPTANTVKQYLQPRMRKRCIHPGHLYTETSQVYAESA